MKVAASRDDEEYSLSMELASKEIQLDLVEKVDRLAMYYSKPAIYGLRENVSRWLRRYRSSV